MCPTISIQHGGGGAAAARLVSPAAARPGVPRSRSGGTHAQCNRAITLCSSLAADPSKPTQTGSLHRVPHACCTTPSAAPGQVLSYLTSAVLVAVTLVAAFLAFGPSRHAGAPTGPSANLSALLAPATPALSAMTDEVLLETTLFGLAYDLPTTPAVIHLTGSTPSRSEHLVPAR